MQPDRNPSEWQQPHETPSPESPVEGAPAVSAPTQAPQPVVSLTPEASPVVDAQPATSPAVEESQPSQDKKGDEIEPVRWQAHEYIHHEKNAIWFIFFSIVVLALIVIAIFWMQSITFAILVPVMAAALLVYSHRPPRLLDYTLSRQGLHINDRLYPFADFKSFGVVHDGQEYSVMLIPTKRFRAGVSVYFPEEAGEAIVDMLGARLPMQELHLDAIDKIIRKLRL